jgi:hypothetical protein
MTFALKVLVGPRSELTLVLNAARRWAAFDGEPSEAGHLWRELTRDATSITVGRPPTSDSWGTGKSRRHRRVAQDAMLMFRTEIQYPSTQLTMALLPEHVCNCRWQLRKACIER